MARTRKNGINPPAKTKAERQQKKTKSPRSAGEAAGADPAAPAETLQRASKSRNEKRQTKSEAILDLLREREGASIDELVAATGWQAHSVRGFLSGEVGKKMGLEVSSEKIAGGERRYHLAAEQA